MPKIIGESLADHRGQVRDRLFASLDALAGERGYDCVTLADIAAGAGVGRTAVYNHFPDKESVLLAMAADETERYLVRLNDALDGVTAPRDRLIVFIRMQMTELASHHSRMAGVGSALSGPGRQAIRKHITPIMDILTDILTDIVDSAVATGEKAPHDVTAVAHMISSVTAGRFTSGMTEAELDKAIDAAVEFVLHGVCPASP